MNNPQVIHGPVNMAMIWQLVFGEHHSLDLSSWCEAHVDLVLNGLEQTQGETG